MNELNEKELAEFYYKEAYACQMKGQYDRAVELYKKSLSCHRTAEAHTFLGWTYSFMGRLDDAIQQCMLAIHVDPDFGNPYNDIGAYMIEAGRLDEAIAWLQEATRAKRYEPRQFPYYNLARVYIEKGMIAKAIDHLKKALLFDPHYALAKRDLSRLISQLN